MAESIGLRDITDGERGIARRLEACRRTIEDLTEESGRAPGSVRLVVVTKYVGDDVIRALRGLGVEDFGENRIQQLEERLQVFREDPAAKVHFIGHLQRNKARRVFGAADVFHALDSERLLEELERRAASDPDARIPEIYIEVNVSEEDKKTGLPARDLPSLLAACRDAPRVGPRVRGLMGMAARSASPKETAQTFRRLRKLRDRAVEEGSLPAGAELSMGMTDDFEIAIREGATIVRIGSLFFR